jgi:hypothetical protein
VSADDLTLDAIEEPPAERIPGDFLRVKGSGAPRVLRADGSGKRDTYGRPSGLYVGNTFGLDKWKEQRLLIGLRLMLERGEPIDGPADKVIRRAFELAEASLAAERGTAVHQFIDPLHNLRDTQHAERDFVAELDRLGFSPEFVEACRLAYARTLERYGLELLTTEAKCICDEWRVAGSADAFMRCHDCLTFGDGGVIPAGEVVCEDHKTGQLRIVSGRPTHWLHYSAQIAAYARSMHYVIDGDDEWREPWPWAVNQHSGLILHFDVLGALDTDVMAVFVTVDTPGPTRLEVQLEASLIAVGAEVPEAELTADYDELRAWLQGRIDVCGAHVAARRDLATHWPRDLPPLRAGGHSDEQLAVIEQLCDDVEKRHSLPFGPTDPRHAGRTADHWLERLHAVFPASTTTKEQT